MFDKHNFKKTLLSILCCLFLLSAAGQTAVRVSIPDTTVIQHAAFILPVMVENVNEPVIAFQMDLSWNADLLTLEQISTDSTVIMDWDPPVINQTSGHCRLAAYTAHETLIDQDAHPLLFLHLKNNGASETVTQLTLDDFQLFSISRQIPNGQMRHSQIELIENKPPVFIQPLELQIDEDSEAAVQMDDVVEDPNHDPLTYGFTVSDHFTSQWDANTRILTLRPEADYDQTGFVVITAIDVYQQSVSDTLHLIVQPQPDAPSPFSLIAPENRMLFDEDTDTLNFGWTLPVDVDTEDRIEFTFYLCDDQTFNGPNLIQHSALDTNGIMITTPLLTRVNYFWIVRAVDTQNNSVWSATRQFSIGPVSSHIEQPLQPGAFYLYANYPNPFNPVTTIDFDLPSAGHIVLTVFDVRGQQVRQLAEGFRQAGHHQVRWDGRDVAGNPAASGLYFYQLISGNLTAKRSMILIR